MTPRITAALTPIFAADADLVVTSARIKGLGAHQQPTARGARWIAYVSPDSWRPMYVARSDAGSWSASGATEHIRAQWYRTGLEVADALGARHVGFATGPTDPGIWPLEDWVRLALTTIKGTPTRCVEVTFCCDSPGALEAFAAGIVRTST